MIPYLRAIVMALFLPALVNAQPATLRTKPDLPARMATSGAASDSVYRFNLMPPGWHVTAGPGILLFDATQRATGQYSIDSQMHFFPNPPAEGIGVFIGGQNIESDANSYLLFLVRRDGSYRIAQHSGPSARVVKEWTPDSAIVAHPGGDAVVANRLRVTVRPDSILFMVNQKRVTAVAKTGITTDGTFGVRIGARADVHIASLDYVRHLAPIR